MAGHRSYRYRRVFYSGTDNNRYENGVGVIITKQMARSVKNFTPISERVLLIQLVATPVNINIIQVYAPTADKPDEEMGEFYRSITELLRALPKQEILITMGDFNSKLGGGYRSEYIGPHGLGERNHRGDIMEVFVEENEFVVLNTQFKMPPRKFYTWKSPLSGPNRPFRNQIDYILIK